MRILSACVGVAVALAATVLGAGTADATGPLSGTKVRNWQTGFVLGVATNSTVGGARIQYQNGTDDQADPRRSAPRISHALCPSGRRDTLTDRAAVNGG
ncbi:hypothetical protein [Streptomyces sp. NPDC018352]|uniref:hypothetical protein n=1 Tax=Streptomyces sp. NPDC018352 TaxID=3157194 RepID=UPI0033DA8518